MADCFLIRTELGLIPADDEARDAIKHIKLGDAARVKITKARNYKFHRKWWALVTFAFDHWEPSELADSPAVGVVPEKSLERFRKDVIILAGHYEAFYRLDGSVRIEPKSIAFSNMDQDTFEDLYSKTIDVVLKHVFRNYTEDELRMAVDELMAFA